MSSRRAWFIDGAYLLLAWRCSPRMKLFPHSAIAFVCAVALVAASPAIAQDSQTDVPKKTSSDKSNKKKKNKKKDREVASDGEAAKPAKHPSWSPIPGVRMDFKARLESELRAPTPAMGLETGSFDWQDRRLGFEGTAFKRISFEVSHELSQDFEASHELSEKSAWKDAYADVRFAKAFSIQAGRFKLPFGREELTGETNLDFAHRSLAARVLSPGRDPGVMAHGRLLAKTITYQAGYFTRDGDNGRTSQTKGGENAFAARVVVAPFARTPDHLLAPLEIGVATAQSQVENRLGIRGRTVLGDGVFFDRVYVNGPRRRTGLDAGWENGPVALSGEYVMVTEARKGMGFAGDDLPPIVATSWYGAGAWALTGERKHGRLEPARDFLRGGYGAFELVGRVEELRFQSAVYAGAPGAAKLSGNADRATTVGVNWYLNHYVKLQADVIMESIEDPQRSPAPAANGRFTSSVFLLQFRF